MIYSVKFKDWNSNMQDDLPGTLREINISYIRHNPAISVFAWLSLVGNSRDRTPLGRFDLAHIRSASPDVIGSKGAE
jgi:hypothetical protein